MANRCCHPILLWMSAFAVTVISGVIAFLILFTTFASRRGPTNRAFSTELNTSEECAVAHFIFAIIATVVLQQTMALLSTGGHRDYKYRIDKDFKILSFLTIICSLVLAILSIVIFVNRESALSAAPQYNSEGLPVATTVDRISWLLPTTTTSYDGVKLVDKTETNVQTYILTLLVLDISCLVLNAVAVFVIFACNRREQYNVEIAVQSELRSRGARGSKSRH